MRRGINKEDGATLVIVAITLFVMLGMLVITVDLGNLLGARRRIVQGADAAAMAAAVSCARAEGQTVASSQATSYATANQPNAVMVSGYPLYQPSCTAPAGKVTVRLTSEEDNLFAPAIGAGQKGTVRAQATASWGAIGSGVGNVVPFGVNLDNSTCNVPDVPPGTRCIFFMDDDVVGDSNWAPLNLITYPTPPGAPSGCYASDSQMQKCWGWDFPPTQTCDTQFIDSQNEPLKSWIRNGVPWPVYVNYPDKTYVCRVPGQRHDAWPVLEERIGDELLFPVNNPPDQVDQAGGPAPPGQIAKYNIVGFTILRLVDPCSGLGDWTHPWGTTGTCALVRGNEYKPARATDPWRAAGCGPPPLGPYVPSANSWCMVTEWVGYTTNPGGTGGADFGVVAVGLDA